MEHISLTDEAVYAIKTILEGIERGKLEELGKDYPLLSKLNKYELIALRMNLVTLLEIDNNVFQNKIEPAKKIVTQYAQEYAETAQYLEKNDEMSATKLKELAREKALFQKTLLEAREGALKALGLKVWGNESFAIFFHLKGEDSEQLIIDLTDEQKELIKAVFEKIMANTGLEDKMILQIHSELHS